MALSVKISSHILKGQIDWIDCVNGEKKAETIKQGVFGEYFYQTYTECTDF